MVHRLGYFEVILKAKIIIQFSYVLMYIPRGLSNVWFNVLYAKADMGLRQRTRFHIQMERAALLFMFYR